MMLYILDFPFAATTFREVNIAEKDRKEAVQYTNPHSSLYTCFKPQALQSHVPYFLIYPLFIVPVLD
jgi:hypothetical protein